jgi:hypothetical protein
MACHAERIAWFRGCLWGIRHQLSRQPALRRWRRRVCHAIQAEALLLAFDGGRVALGAKELPGALGLPPDQARAVARRAVRDGILLECGTEWVLSRSGRRLYGELERAYAEAIQQLLAALEGDLEPVTLEALGRLWSRLEDMGSPEIGRAHV